MSSPFKLSVPCNLCGGTDVEKLADRGRHNTPIQTVICRDCGLAWTDPRPTANTTRKFYREEYRQLYKSAFTPGKKHVYRDMKRAMERFRRIKPFLETGMKLLDIGAGGGFFPYVVRYNGFEVTGIEPNSGYAQYAIEEFELDVINGFLQDVELEDCSFDIITLNHVLEHLDDPYAALVRISGWLKPDGCVNVEVPNIEATYHAPRNKFHHAHLYTFNPENLSLLGEKAGFTVYDLKLMSVTRHINVIFKKTVDQMDKSKTGAPHKIPGNHDRIRRIFDAHTGLSHYLSATPYLRFIRRISGYLVEVITVSRFNRGRELADYLITKQNT